MLCFVLNPSGGPERRARLPEEARSEALLRRARQGDMDAYADLIRENEGRIYGVIVQYVRDEEAALDLTREVFYKAYRSLPRFRGNSRFSSWICRIAINRSIDYLRRGRSVRVESLDAPITTDVGDLERDPADTAPTPEVLAERNELAERIAEAVALLSPKLRAVIVLREYQGLSIEEVGETLGLSPGTVKSRVFRARERLRELLAPYIEDRE